MNATARDQTAAVCGVSDVEIKHQSS